MATSSRTSTSSLKRWTQHREEALGSNTRVSTPELPFSRVAGQTRAARLYVRTTKQTLAEPGNERPWPSGAREAHHPFSTKDHPCSSRTILLSNEKPASFSCSESGVCDAHVRGWLTPFRMASSAVSTSATSACEAADPALVRLLLRTNQASASNDAGTLTMVPLATSFRR